MIKDIFLRILDRYSHSKLSPINVKFLLLSIYLPTQIKRLFKSIEFDDIYLSFFALMTGTSKIMPSFNDRFYMQNQVFERKMKLYFKIKWDSKSHQHYCDLEQHFMQIRFSFVICCFTFTMFHHLIFCMKLDQISLIKVIIRLFQYSNLKKTIFRLYDCTSN